MTAEANVNPMVTVPVAAVSLLNKVIAVLGDAMLVMVGEQEIQGFGYLENSCVDVQWEDDVPQDLMNRVEAATEEINKTIAFNPLIGICTGDGQSLQLFIRAE